MSIQIGDTGNNYGKWGIQLNDGNCTCWKYLFKTKEPNMIMLNIEQHGLSQQMVQSCPKQYIPIWRITRIKRWFVY